MNPTFIEGYNAQSSYVPTYRSEYAPLQLRFAALAGGVLTHPPAQFRYLELGCGQGYGVCVLAALYPQAQFFGVDMMAEHIEAAQKLSRDIGLVNATFEITSFRSMLERLGDFADMDYVVLHGVYSWIDDDNRALLADILRGIVKPGGMVYISYNAMPGGAGTVAVQQLVMEHLRQNAAESGATAAQSAMTHALALADAGAGFFQAHPHTLERTKQVARFGGNYVAHEFAHPQWAVLPFGAVARAMQGCGLVYAGPAHWRFSLADLGLTPSLLEQVAAAQDPVWRETLIGYALNTQFRADVFVRDPQPSTAEERQRVMRETPVMLFMENHLAERMFVQDWGLPRAACTQWLQRLAQGPVSIGELYDTLGGSMSWPWFMTLMRDAMVRQGCLHLAHSSTPHCPAAMRLNRWTMTQKAFSERGSHLLYPAIGTALDLGQPIALMAELCEHQPDADGAQLIEQAMALLARRHQTVQGVRGQPNDALYDTLARSELARFASGFAENVNPFLRRAGLAFQG